MSEDPQENLYDLALVGMAGRFPGARDVEELWRNLRDGVESIVALSDEDLEAAGVPRQLRDDPSYVKAAADLDDVSGFDAALFDMSPREAEILDPQHRLFLECAWHALEDAGCDPATAEGAIGVYAGTFLSTYLIHHLLPQPERLRSLGEVAVRHGNEKDYLATRTSYKLNLRGPSLSVQTSCSTSLVAAHLACQALLNRECDLALAGGVALALPPRRGYLWRPGGVLSPDGRCRPFDAEAGGTVFGQGVGVVALKRLADALADGDRVYAVVKGSAINNDGAAKVGYTAPSADGQAAVIAEALAMAGVDPETIGYVEAHGTATPLGDPIEIAALTRVYREHTAATGFCAIGSVKSNVGHLSAAAGVTGLVKTALMLHHRRLVPSLHFTAPNPQIDFAAGPFYVSTDSRPWEGDAPRRAAVSSFGMGGTNAHMVLEEAPPAPPSEPGRPWQLMVLSAATPAALETAGARLADHLRAAETAGAADVAYTLQVGRTALPHRRAVVCRDAADAAEVLGGGDPQRLLDTGTAVDGSVALAFLFPGQGAQYPGMTRELYETEAAFREEVDRCCELLRPALGPDLRGLLLPPPGEEEEAARRLDDTAFTQPALFTVEYALARLLIGWGLRPRAMAGHSIGEYVAACLAGVFSLADALALVAERGRLMATLPRGAMLGVSLSASELAQRLPDTLALAAVNAPQACTVSGAEPEIGAFAAELEAAGVRHRRLHTSHAFHSAMMEPILEPFAERLRAVELQAPTERYLSNLTGGWISAEEATDPGYWTRHLRQTVRFSDNAERLLAEDGLVLLEVGPGRTLSSLLALQEGGRGRLVLPTVRPPRDEGSDVAFLHRTLGRLWLAGAAIDWPAFHAGTRRRRLPLPRYPFERQRYWIDAGAPAGSRTPLPEKRDDVGKWFYLPSWKQARPPLPPAAEAAGTWWVFADAAGLGSALAERLRARRLEVKEVYAGRAWSTADGRYEVDPGCLEHYEKLLQELGRDGARPAGIVHLWSVTGRDEVDDGELRNRGFYSLLYLAQALAAASWNETLRIGVVADGLWRIDGDEEIRPEKATLLGPAQVVPQEHPHLRCRTFDVVVPDAEEALRATAERLADDLLGASTEPFVAWRGGRRWQRGFEPVELPAAGGRRLRPRGVYLITGGLGGLGLVHAEHLARQVSARLVLLGRSGLPPREEWDGHGAKDATGRKIAAVRRLEELGAEVLVVSADVADREQTAAALAAAHERFGPLNGVIHAAGAPGSGIVERQSRESTEAVLAPKVAGCRVLAELLAGAPLDFALLLSSTTAVAGGLGSVDYCAANAYLDAFAQAGGFAGAELTAAVNWGTWAEVGMAATADGPGGLGDEHRERAILPHEGVEALARILADDLVQVVVSPWDLDALIRERNATSAQELLAALDERRAGASRYPRPQLATAYVAPNDETERRLAEIWGEVLGLEKVGVHDNFFELGGNSLTGIEVVARLREAFGVEIPVTSLYDGSTVAAMTERLRPAEERDRSRLLQRQSRGARRRQKRLALQETEEGDPS